MNYNRIAAIACGIAFACGAFAQMVEEITTDIGVSAATASGVLGGTKSDPETGWTDAAFSVMGNETTFSLSDSGYTSILDINNSMTMVGATYFEGTYHGFVRTPDGNAVRYMFPGAEATTINAVTDGGRMLCWQYTNPDNYGDFIRETDGTTTPFVVPGYEDGMWYDMNNRGQVMGTGFDDGYNSGLIGLIWSMGNVQEVVYSGARHTILVDINNRGDVLGEAVMPYDPDLGDVVSYAFVRRGNGQIETIEYQPDWAPTILEDSHGETVEMEFQYTLGTRACAMDDTGRVIFRSVAFYVHFGPYGPESGTVKERFFAIRP